MKYEQSRGGASRGSAGRPQGRTPGRPQVSSQRGPQRNSQGRPQRSTYGNPQGAYRGSEQSDAGRGYGAQEGQVPQRGHDSRVEERTGGYRTRETYWAKKMLEFQGAKKTYGARGYSKQDNRQEVRQDTRQGERQFVRQNTRPPRKHVKEIEEEKPAFPMRINKYLSIEGKGSRREMDVIVREGKVLINGVTAMLGSKVNEGDKVEVRFRTPKKQDR